MKCQLSRQEIIEPLADFIKGEVREEDDKYIVKVTRINTLINLHASFSEIDSLSSKLSKLEINDETTLFNDFEYEVPVRLESNNPILQSRLRVDGIEVNDEEKGLRYELSVASDHYLAWLLNAIRKKLSLKYFRFLYTPALNHQINTYIEKESERKGFIDFIRLNSFTLFTLKISSDKKRSYSQYSKLTHAFLYDIGYNLDIALVPQRLLEEMIRRSRITRMRDRSRIEKINPPRREYNEDIVQHYLLAVSTENPLIEYLSYYHILEHFYYVVFYENLKIEKFSEIRALELCLLKYTSLPELRSKLAEYDETLLNYYKKTRVEFSDGVEIDLDSNDTKESILAKLAKRIYYTRNALVHSKDGDKPKYTPFKDDRVLVKEVPLMRFIAEMVILAESTVE